MPFGGLLTDIANHDRFLGSVLDGYWTKVNFIGEVQECAAPYGPNWNYEFFTLCNDCQVVSVINFGLWTESNRVLDLHPWGYAAGHDIYVRSSLSSCGFEFFDGEDLK